VGGDEPVRLSDDVVGGDEPVRLNDDVVGGGGMRWRYGVPDGGMMLRLVVAVPMKPE
jgi:hypothetical protein